MIKEELQKQLERAQAERDEALANLEAEKKKYGELLDKASKCAIQGMSDAVIAGIAKGVIKDLSSALKGAKVIEGETGSEDRIEFPNIVRKDDEKKFMRLFHFIDVFVDGKYDGFLNALKGGDNE